MFASEFANVPWLANSFARHAGPRRPHRRARRDAHWRAHTHTHANSAASSNAKHTRAHTIGACAVAAAATNCRRKPARSALRPVFNCVALELRTSRQSGQASTKERPQSVGALRRRRARLLLSRGPRLLKIEWRKGGQSERRVGQASDVGKIETKQGRQTPTHKHALCWPLTRSLATRTEASEGERERQRNKLGRRKRARQTRSGAKVTGPHKRRSLGAARDS